MRAKAPGGGSVGWLVVDHFNRQAIEAVLAEADRRVFNGDLLRLLRRIGADVFEDSFEVEHGRDGRGAVRGLLDAHDGAGVPAPPRLCADPPAPRAVLGVHPHGRTGRAPQGGLRPDAQRPGHRQPPEADPQVGEGEGPAGAGAGLSGRRRRAGQDGEQPSVRRGAEAGRRDHWASATRVRRVVPVPLGSRRTGRLGSLPAGGLRGPPVRRRGDHERVGRGDRRPVRDALRGPQATCGPIAGGGRLADGAARLRLPAVRQAGRTGPAGATLARVVRVLRAGPRGLGLLEPALAADAVAARARWLRRPCRRGVRSGRPRVDVTLLSGASAVAGLGRPDPAGTPEDRLHKGCATPGSPGMCWTRTASATPGACRAAAAGARPGLQGARRQRPRGAPGVAAAASSRSPATGCRRALRPPAERGAGFEARGPRTPRCASRQAPAGPQQRAGGADPARPRALAALGARRPRLRAGRAGPIVPVHRRTATGDVWFLFNDSNARVTRRLTFATRGAPAKIDLWTGQATWLGRYTEARAA